MHVNRVLLRGAQAAGVWEHSWALPSPCAHPWASALPFAPVHRGRSPGGSSTAPGPALQLPWGWEQESGGPFGCLVLTLLLMGCPKDAAALLRSWFYAMGSAMLVRILR